jgi:mono/diheme cytochrome c family protein
MSVFRGILIVALSFCAVRAFAADPGRGKDIAEHQCAACHQVARIRATSRRTLLLSS